MTHSWHSISRLAFCALLAACCFGAAPRAGASEINAVKDQISDINTSVESKKKALQEIEGQASKYRGLIMNKQIESASIEDEIGLLDSNIAKHQLDIEIARDQIKAAELEIKLTQGSIDDHERHIAKQRLLLGGLARKLHREQFGKSPFESLLGSGTISDLFDRWQAMASLQSSVTKAALALKETKAALEAERRRKEQRQQEQQERRLSLETSQRELEDVKLLKQSLLIETKASELEYRYALGELEKEQTEADVQIRTLERALREKRDLLEQLGRGTAVLSWPVDPSRGLTALFHDEEYPFRHLFEHPAIDIRAYQGTPVRAAAAGIVATAKDAGMGYSYVMLIHSGGISTVYGHLSKIYVTDDAYVDRGEVIGLSGGMPGTSGAGRLTTGPHLHFEVRDGGIPTDPLNFLP
jgi:murein DD-endopeptidase MepM/ murein hydrolase activator NlpD